MNATVSPRRSASYDPTFALAQAQIVDAVYSMYDADPNNLTPAPCADFPADYTFAAWVLMQDFIFENTGLTFYGVIAQSKSDMNRYVLAIRGTSSWVEWWDDLNAIVLVPFKNPDWGEVGYGFARIYETLEVRPATVSGAAAQSLKSVGGFAEQVAALTMRRAAQASAQIPPAAVDVAGHSLGSALATLFALDASQISTFCVSSMYTFASPRVGDATFAGAFDALNLTSWRVVNDLDIVPRVPLGYTHVAMLQEYDCGLNVWPTPSCWHSLLTYISLINPMFYPDPACRWDAARVASRAAPLAAQQSVSIPAGPVTVNVTINVEKAGEG